MDNINATLKTTADAGAGVITVGAIIDWIPEATAILSLIWVGIRIYETKTFQSIITKKRKNPKIK